MIIIKKKKRSLPAVVTAPHRENYLPIMDSSGRPKSRFSFQQKGTYGAVAPPRPGAASGQSYGAVQHQAQRSLAVPVQPQLPSKPARDYFDDEDDDTGGYSAYNSVAGNPTKDVADDDYDPLDDFM
jgi:hypothetical protein